MHCRCGASGCRHTIGRDDVLTLSPVWDREVAKSLPFAVGVMQPLLPFARDAEQFWDWANGTAPLPSQRDYHAGFIVRSPELASPSAFANFPAPL